MALKRLKLPQIFNVVARTFPTNKHVCRKMGKNLRISAEKAIFLVSRGENLISPILAILETYFEKIDYCPPFPPKKILPTPKNKHVKLHHFCEKLCCITTSGNTVQQHQWGKQFIAGRQTAHGAFCQTITKSFQIHGQIKNIIL